MDKYYDIRKIEELKNKTIEIKIDNKTAYEDERITYEEFISMFKFAPRIAYTLYDKAEDEIEKITKEKEHYKHLYSELKKQKDDVAKYIKNTYNNITKLGKRDLLRMLGEIDE